MDELTAEAVAEAFRGFGMHPVAMRMTTGEGLLHCGSCDGLLRGGHRGSASWAPDASADYDCPTCGTVSVPVRRVDAQLQRLTRRRLEADEFVQRWKESRAAELDARIAEGQRIRAWCLEPGNRQKLARRIGGPLGIGGRGKITWGLIQLADQMVARVEERAGLAGPAEGAARLRELGQAKRDYSITYLSTRRGSAYSAADKAKRRELIRLAGGRRQLKADLRILDRRLWELLAETRWCDAGPAQLPAADKAMTHDWATSPTTMVRRRHELVRLALGEESRLVVDPEGHVHVTAN